MSESVKSNEIFGWWFRKIILIFNKNDVWKIRCLEKDISHLPCSYERCSLQAYFMRTVSSPYERKKKAPREGCLTFWWWWKVIDKVPRNGNFTNLLTRIEHGMWLWMVFGLFRGCCAAVQNDSVTKPTINSQRPGRKRYSQLSKRPWGFGKPRNLYTMAFFEPLQKGYFPIVRYSHVPYWYIPAGQPEQPAGRIFFPLPWHNVVAATRAHGQAGPIPDAVWTWSRLRAYMYVVSLYGSVPMMFCGDVPGWLDTYTVTPLRHPDGGGWFSIHRRRAPSKKQGLTAIASTSRSLQLQP